jgi:TatD DNase family protein
MLTVSCTLSAWIVNTWGVWSQQCVYDAGQGCCSEDMSTEMKALPSLDVHAHLDQSHASCDLTESGAVLAMTLSVEEAALSVSRHEPYIVWGVGCHPRKSHASEAFDIERFRVLTAQTAVVGEIGLDTGSHYRHAPLETQLRAFRAALDVVADIPRIVSIHSFRATRLVVDELRERPIAVPILHWWTGTAEETREAVAMGCYFSVHSAVARYSKFRTVVPPDRILLESDHGYGDPPAAIPCRIEWVEHLVAQQLGLSRDDVRRLAWQNFAVIVQKTDTHKLLPEGFAATLAEVSQDVSE